MSDRDAVQAGWDAYLAAPTHRDMGRSKVEAAIIAALKAAREQGGESFGCNERHIATVNRWIKWLDRLEPETVGHAVDIDVERDDLEALLCALSCEQGGESQAPAPIVEALGVLVSNNLRPDVQDKLKAVIKDWREQQGGEAVAFISKGNLDYLKRNPSSTVDATLDESIIYGTKPVPLYTHSQPAKVPEWLPIFAQRMGEQLEEAHDMSGFEPIILAIAEDLLTAPPEGAE